MPIMCCKLYTLSSAYIIAGATTHSILWSTDVLTYVHRMPNTQPTQADHIPIHRHLKPHARYALLSPCISSLTLLLIASYSTSPRMPNAQPTRADQIPIYRTDHIPTYLHCRRSILYCCWLLLQLYSMLYPHQFSLSMTNKYIIYTIRYNSCNGGSHSNLFPNTLAIVHCK